MPINRSVRCVSPLAAFVDSLVHRFRFSVVPLIALVALMLPPIAARAGIAGFNNLNGWTYNQSDAGSPADLPVPDTIHLTTGNGQGRSIFFDTPQDITQFTASFTYRATNLNPSLVGQGIAFVLQNDARGPNAIGGRNGGLGYTGIAPSATTILWSDTGPGLTYNGYFTGGILGSGSNPTTPANAFNFRDLNMTATYANPILTVTVDDPVIPGVDFTRNYVVGDLPSIVGGSTAYVGFTASTGDGFGNGGANQYLSNFSYVPEPATLALFLLGSAGLIRRLRPY
jgi:hypothetical protein